MEDFRNSVAHLDVSVSTDITYESVTGENYYRFLYISQKTGITPTLLTKDTYADTLAELLSDPDNLALATKNLASLFEYASSAQGYIISVDSFDDYKYKAYHLYVETAYGVEKTATYEEATVPAAGNPAELGLYEKNADDEYVATTDTSVQVISTYDEVSPTGSEDPASLSWYEEDGSGGYVLSTDNTVDASKTYYVRTDTDKVYYEKTEVPSAYTLSAEAKAVLDALDAKIDSAYSTVYIDLAIPYTVKKEDVLTTELLAELNKYGMDLAVYARGAEEDLSWKGENVGIGYSPALYQLGRTLGYINTRGTPVGNSMDTVQVSFQDVLLTRDTSTTDLTNPNALVVAWLENAKVQYFKTIGDATGNLSLYGGWTIKGNCQCANWIVAYVNYMTKVTTAEILTAMNTFKSASTYKMILSKMQSNMQPFVELSRVYNYQVTAPEYSQLPKANGHTITIPNAWTGIYQDNLRKVNIQGSLTVSA